MYCILTSCALPRIADGNTCIALLRLLARIIRLQTRVRKQQQQQQLASADGKGASASAYIEVSTVAQQWFAVLRSKVRTALLQAWVALHSIARVARVSICVFVSVSADEGGETGDGYRVGG